MKNDPNRVPIKSNALESKVEKTEKDSSET
jgi:hypothetical protein